MKQLHYSVQDFDQSDSRSMGSTEDGDSNIEDWLEKLYFDEVKKLDLSHDDIGKLKLLLRKLICCDPDGRYMANTAVRDVWFEDSQDIEKMGM